MCSVLFPVFPGQQHWRRS